MLWIINVGTLLMLVILGLVFRAGKGSFLIAGYNTAPKEREGFNGTFG